MASDLHFSLQALLKRSCHYWNIIVDIITDKDSYRDIPKYHTPDAKTPKYEGDPDKIPLLNEARMALANAALYKSDIGGALSLYSRVKTPHAAWNQSQVGTESA